MENKKFANPKKICNDILEIKIKDSPYFLPIIQTLGSVVIKENFANVVMEYTYKNFLTETISIDLNFFKPLSIYVYKLAIERESQRPYKIKIYKDRLQNQKEEFYNICTLLPEEQIVISCYMFIRISNLNAKSCLFTLSSNIYQIVYTVEQYKQYYEKLLKYNFINVSDEAYLVPWKIGYIEITSTKIIENVELISKHEANFEPSEDRKRVNVIIEMKNSVSLKQDLIISFEKTLDQFEILSWVTKPNYSDSYFIYLCHHPLNHVFLDEPLPDKLVNHNFNFIIVLNITTESEEELEKAKLISCKILKNLPTGSSFNILRVGKIYNFVFNDNLPSTEENVRTAIDKIHQINYETNTVNFDILNFEKFLKDEPDNPMRIIVISNAQFSHNLIFSSSNLTYNKKLYYVNLVKQPYLENIAYAFQHNGYWFKTVLDREEIDNFVKEIIDDVLTPYIIEFNYKIKSLDVSVSNPVRSISEPFDQIIKIYCDDLKENPYICISYEAYDGQMIAANNEINIDSHNVSTDECLQIIYYRDRDIIDSKNIIFIRKKYLLD